MNDIERKPIQVHRRARWLLLATLAVFCTLADAEPSDRVAAAAAELAAAHIAYATQALGGPEGPEEAGLPASGLDCMTFVEAALMRAQALTSTADQARWLQLTRYDDRPPAYCTRAHYLSDWIDRNSARGWIADITGDIADSSKITLHQHRWTRHWMAEHHLDPSGCIDAQGTAAPIDYIAPADYASAAALIRPGDILAFVASSEGLDSAHVAIAQAGGSIAMASSTSGRTVLKPNWQTYARAQARFLGLRVFRVLEWPSIDPEKTSPPNSPD